jgi:hypothetical protein
MRIFNRAHVPWGIFVVLATAFACWVYVGNFHSQALPSGLQVPAQLVQRPSGHHSIGGTPLGLIFGAISFGIFIFATLLGVRKKVVLWRIGNLQRWLRAHIWLTLLTIPLVILHSGFRLGGPMTTVLIALYIVVMVSGIYGLALQHQMPRMMMERLPAESVYEQIPHIRGQLYAAAQKMRDSFKPAVATKTDAGAPTASPAKAVTTGSTPMASTAATVSTPTARAKTVVGSTIIAETVGASAPVPPSPPTPTPVDKVEPALAPSAISPAPVAAAPGSAPPPAATAGATVKAAPTKPAAPPAKAAPAPPTDAASEAALLDFLDRQILPYLSVHRGDRFRLGDRRFSEDIFRFVKLRVTEAYRARVEEIQAWCDERRMLDLQVKMQHWLHGWLFIHAPVSFLLLMLTAWHAIVTLFYY